MFLGRRGGGIRPRWGAADFTAGGAGGRGSRASCCTPRTGPGRLPAPPFPSKGAPRVLSFPGRQNPICKFRGKLWTCRDGTAPLSGRRLGLPADDAQSPQSRVLGALVLGDRHLAVASALGDLMSLQGGSECCPVRSLGRPCTRASGAWGVCPAALLGKSQEVPLL